MADEPRRSVRATKGQHTKMDLETLDEPKKRGKRGSKKQAEKDDDGAEELVRCVCGVTSADNDEGEAWIGCEADGCGVWQHNVCVGISTFEDEIPKTYMCEVHDPVFHKDLHLALARGEKIWEERRKAHQQRLRDEENTPKKKAGRAGARGSNKNLDIGSANGKAKSPSVPASDIRKEKGLPGRSSSTKRKAMEESHQGDDTKEPQSKARKMSADTTPHHKTSSSDLPVKILDLDTAQQGHAKLILKGLVHAIPIAVSGGIYTYGEGENLSTKSERLAIQVADAVQSSHPSNAAVVKQCRAIGANIKTNQELCNGLLTNTLSPQALAVMDSDDMATRELKKETAVIKAQLDKQSIMITEDAPRHRTTHKGVEVVEDDNFAVSEDTTTSNIRRRSQLDPNIDLATRSRENSLGEQVEHPAIDYTAHDNIRSHVPKRALTVDTKPKTPARKQSSAQANFDISKVFDSVQSPNGVPPVRRPSGNAPPVNGPGSDPEIDKLLEDDEADSPPYSPTENESDPDIIWKGMVTMDSIAKFPAVAKHVAGADLTRARNPLPWSAIVEKDLRIAGRIDQEKANEYLCSLRYSPPTDVVIISVSPVNEAAQEGFQTMYDYFYSKNRYGVLTNKGVGNIRDTYLVPVPASPLPLPDFVTNLEGHRISEHRPNPSILVAIVIRNEWQPDQRSPNGFSVPEGGSPSLQSHPQRQMSLSGTGPSMSPIAAQTASFASTANQHANASLTPEAIARRRQQDLDQKEGEATALRILGDYMRAPTVGFLMPQAYQMRALEWEVIKGILESDERARDDLQHLSQVLEIRMSQQGSESQGGH